jgi:Right handed beta helix region
MSAPSLPNTDIVNNKISSNETGGKGGGISIRDCGTGIRITNNVIGGFQKGNDAHSGGGISLRDTLLFQIKDNKISHNRADKSGVRRSGGGILIIRGSRSARVIKNSITENIAADRGAGIFLQGGAEIERNFIQGNRTTEEGSGGGGLWLTTPEGETAPKLVNNFIADNETKALGGGGIYIEEGAGHLIMNNTIAHNEAPVQKGGGMYVAFNASCDIKNTILWDNGDNLHIVAPAESYVTYCDIEDGPGTGAGNISEDPEFDSDGLHITRDSPCIDAGHFGGSPSVDYDGDTRPQPQGAEVDIGADEFFCNTPPGTDVEVDAGSGIIVTFSEVTEAGNTTAAETTCSAAAPSGFTILPLADSTCYDVQTTATYSGTVDVCITYDDTGVIDESNLKLFAYEDPPGEWVDITTSIDTVNNIICGETDHLSQFAVMVEDEATVPAKFDFNDGTNQGWTLQGAYDENGNGTLSSNFIFGWKDYVNYPNPPGGDPSGDNNGSVQLFTMAGHGINNPGATWWIMQFHSPDLSSSITWQTAKGYSVQIAECMAVMTSLSANLYVKVYDIDQDKDRYFYSGTAQELQHDIYGDDIANWNHLIFDWSEISAFPTNYVVKEVFVNIWGKMSGYFEGGVYLDEVMPILGTSTTPDLDGDGDADGLDLAAFASAFGSTSGDLNYNPGADFDNNGNVDENDLAVFATDFSQTGRGPVLYFADAAENPGSIYKIENGTESTYYNRTAGKLYSFAFSPERTLYYSNTNDYDLYKLEGGGETLVYHHNTYLRDVAFDSKGRIYFSEARGSGGNGYIYRLEDGVASLYYTVLLSDVGSWAGDFTFDRNNNLYLSNGNRAGANIYKVVDEVPQIVFSAPSNEPIKGISFDPAGNLFYASWLGGNIYQIDLSTGERRLFYSNPDHSWLSDVFVW